MAEQDRIADFREVLELLPEDPDVRFGLAGACLAAERFESAVGEVPGRYPPQA